MYTIVLGSGFGIGKMPTEPEYWEVNVIKRTVRSAVFSGRVY